MPAKKTAPRKTRRSAVTVASRPKAKARATTDTRSLKQHLNAAVEEARETSRENMLAGIGLIARLRKQREERMAELVAEGKRFEHKVKQAIEDLKARVQPSEELKARFKLSDELKARIQPSEELKAKFDLSKFKLDAGKFDRDAINARLEQGKTDALHRLGLATRKEVEVLARKVNKLSKLQAA